MYVCKFIYKNIDQNILQYNNNDDSMKYIKQYLIFVIHNNWELCHRYCTQSSK